MYGMRPVIIFLASELVRIAQSLVCFGTAT